MKRLILFAFLLASCQALAQVLWVEDFEAEADGATTGTAGGTIGGDWNSNNASFARGSVLGNRFYSYQTGAEREWITDPIDISGTGRAIIDMNVFGVLVGGGDYIRCYYKLDGLPAEHLFFEQDGGLLNFSLTGSAIVTGSSLEIIARSDVDGILTSFSLDDVTVTAVTTLYSRKSGNWNDVSVGNGTWSAIGLGGVSCDCTPLTTDYLIIGNSNTVNINVAATAGGIELRNTGALQWTVGGIDLNIDRGILQVDVGASINRNGQTNVQLDFDRGIINSFINNGTITTEDIEVNGANATLNISGGGSINLTGDFRILEDDIIVTNDLTGTFTIGDDLVFDQPGDIGSDDAQFVNNQTLTISSDIVVGASNDDDNVFTNAVGAVLNVVNLNFTDGDFDFFNAGTVNQTGNFTNISNADTNIDNLISGVWNWTLTPNTTFDTDVATVLNCTAVGNTFNYNAAGAQRIIPASYHHLNLSTSGAKDANNANFSVAGNWTVSGTATFTEGTGTVTLNGSANAQTITNPSGETFNNLTINNSFGTSPQITFANAITVTTVLTMTAGNVNLTGTTFILSSTAAGALVHGLASTGGWMYGGSFRRTFPTTAITVGTAAGFFPLGSSSDWRPFFIGKNNIASSGGNMTVSHTNSTTTSIVSVDDGGTPIVRRHDSFWTPVTSGIAAGTWNLRAGGTNFGTIASNAHIRMMISAAVVGAHAAGSGGPTDWRVNRTGLTFGQLANNFHVSSTDAINSPLPIELVEFNALVEKDKVRLNWVTSSELNNDFFTIERTQNIEDFQSILTLTGKGTTQLTSYYTAFDDRPFSGKSYYRLKQTDFDGTYSYSDVVMVEYVDSGEQLLIYPNPSVNKKFTVEVNNLKPFEEIYIGIVDMRGTIINGSVHTASSGGFVQAEIDLEGIAAGLYFVLVNSSSTMRAKVMVE
ncbi:MAG: T9SS type A sorting domain-containing protein [Flammeovirgaceae bacterium]|nr:T9SS type A sorting domain-containing protein [Flammeovirgaceae bacterium]